MGEKAEGLALAQSQYQASHAGKNLAPFTGEAQQARPAALEWLLGASGQ